MNFRIVRDQGRFLAVPGVMALAALPFTFFDEQPGTFAAFGLTAVFCLTLAGLLHFLPVKDGHEACSAMSTVALAWLIIAALCGVPFYLSARFAAADSELARSYGTALNSFFEGMSGITSCGLTLSAHPEQLPSSIQWWRSLCEWIGGVGVVVLMFLLIEPAEKNYLMYEAEARSWRLGTSLRQTAFRIWTIFLILTAAAILGLHWAGAPWWEAVNHGMTAVSTGGFTIRSGSFQGLETSVQITAMLFMFLGAISFRTYHETFDDHLLPWKKSTQLRWLAALLLVGALGLIGIQNLSGNDLPMMQPLFQWVSALGTCGFSSADLSTWTPPGLILLVIAMVIGGASGSTTGGIKISRVVWLTKNAVKHIRRRLCNDDVESYCFNGEEVDSEEAGERIKYAALLTGLWMVSLLTGWFVLMIVLPGQKPVLLLFEAASALGSVGLSSGVTTASMPAAAKLCLSLLMWIGRLEIISVLMLVITPFRRLLRGQQDDGSNRR